VTLLEALILGAVQGVFMFVPVSSTAHLVITQHLMIRGGSALPPPDSPEMILFDLVVHVGTLVSIAIVFHRSLAHLALATWQDTAEFLRRPTLRPRIGIYLRLVLLGLLTVLVTGVLGLAFKGQIERVFGAPQVVAAMLAVTAVLLWVTDRLGPRRIGLRDIGIVIAVAVGVAQALALVPGISRSGITIIAALLLGMRRRWAAEYSFLVAIPTILAATLVQGAGVVASGNALAGVGAGPLVVGFAVAAVVGTVALRLVLVLLYRAQLKIFSIYLFGFAALVAAGALDGLL
jgi:undecaprenyl-diphosphatase